MSTEFNRINAARPGKIVEMLRVIDASARSQKASPDEVRALLAPVYEKLGVPGTVPAPVPAPVPEPHVNMTPGPITTHDGLNVVALRACLRRSSPEEVRAALEWCIRHNVAVGGAT